VLLRLFEKDVVQQPSFVVVKFDNHEILAINQLGPSAVVLPNPENQNVDFYFAPVPAFLYSVRSIVILLHWLHVAVVKPCHGMTIGAEHCRAGHIQA
jgi:hypothetical protein